MRDWVPELRTRLASLHLPPVREREILEELSQHLDDYHRELVTGGLSPEDAAERTFIELRRVDLLAPRLAPLRQAQSRPAPPIGMPAPWGSAGVWQDIVFAVRLFRRRAGVMSLAFAGLACAIGLGTVVFSTVNALAFRPMEVAAPDTVVSVWRQGADGRPVSWTYGDYVRFRDTATLMRAEAWFVRSAPASEDFAAPWHERTPMHFVSSTFLQTFGATAARGRLLTADDDRANTPVVAVVNYTFWVNLLDRDPAIVGRTLKLGDTPVTIVGVASREFGGPANFRDAPAAFWLPLGKRDAFGTSATAQSLNQQIVEVIGRLQAPEAIAAAEAQASAMVAALSNNASQTARLNAVDARLSMESRLMVFFALVVVTLVLLLACANVGNLLLAGATVRQPEIATRLALGASRRRIIRQLMTESLLLGGAGGAVGLLLAVWLGPAVAHIAWIPMTVDLTPDLRVFAFVAFVSVAGSVAAGLAPARQAVRRDVAAALKTGLDSIAAAPRASRLRHTLIAVQAAASIIFLVLASLFGRALVVTSRVAEGYDVNRLAIVDWKPDAARTPELQRAAADRLRTLPDVDAVAFADYAPFRNPERFALRSADGQRTLALQVRTTPEYFSTLGMRVRRGRTYSDAEVRTNAPVAVVSATLARKYWGGADSIGRPLDAVHPSLATIQVIGVTEDIVTDARRQITSMVFQPLADLSLGRMLVKSRGDVAALSRPIRDALLALDPASEPGLQRVDADLEQRVEIARMVATVAGILSGFAVLLAVMGLIGVTAFVVEQRRREIGVRLALGAGRADILRLLLGHGLRPVVIGLAVGLIVAVASSGLVTSLLYGVGPRDPIAIAGAIVTLLVSAGIAVIVPAHRATRLDPARVLRDS